MANGGSIIIGLIITVLASVVAWFLSPKGETQTIWRSSLILSFASCYIMWGDYILGAMASTYYAPKRRLETGIRETYEWLLEMDRLDNMMAEREGRRMRCIIWRSWDGFDSNRGMK
ncbi:hypothetical protein EAF04_009380 [Stromatinia cepivora]|nr:hypothetical protein EAF04_009380 [Stromatinia cepivora]